MRSAHLSRAKIKKISCNKNTNIHKALLQHGNMGMLMDNPTKEWRDVDPTNINVTDENHN